MYYRLYIAISPYQLVPLLNVLNVQMSVLFAAVVRSGAVPPGKVTAAGQPSVGVPDAALVRYKVNEEASVVCPVVKLNVTIPAVAGRFP